MGYPVRAAMGRTVPTAGNPDVTASIPAVIAVDPDKFGSGRRRTALDDGGRRSNLDYYLREGSGRRECSCKQKCENSFFHDSLLLVDVSMSFGPAVLLAWPFFWS